MSKVHTTTQRSHTTRRSGGDFPGQDVPWKTNIGLVKAEKILSVHPQGVVRPAATKLAIRVVECLGRHRISPGRPQTNTAEQISYRGSLVQSDISRAPV